MRCFRVVVHNYEAAQALGLPSHVVQVEVIGAFKSKAAFARALAATKLFLNEGQALREIRRGGGETRNDKSIAVASVSPEQLFVGPLNGTSRSTYKPWPLVKYPHARASHDRWKARREAADRVLAFLTEWEGRDLPPTVFALGIGGPTIEAADLRTLAESV